MRTEFSLLFSLRQFGKLNFGSIKEKEKFCLNHSWELKGKHTSFFNWPVYKETWSNPNAMIPKLTDTITVMAEPREPSFPSKYLFFLSQLHERKIDINSKSVPTNITFHSLQILFILN